MSTEPLPQVPEAGAVITEPLPQVPEAGAVITEPLPQVPEAGDFATEPNGANCNSGRGRRVAQAVRVVVFFGIGAVVGSVAVDPTASDEYAALAASKAVVQEERDELQADYNGLRENYSTLHTGVDDRDGGIAKTESGLKAGAAAVKKREAAVASAVKKREAAVASAVKKREAAAAAAEKNR